MLTIGSGFEHLNYQCLILILVSLFLLWMNSRITHQNFERIGAIWVGSKIKKPAKQTICELLTSFDIESGGERGIRTPGPLTVNGFQDRRIRPLCHLSGAKIKVEVYPPKKINNPVRRE